LFVNVGIHAEYWKNSDISGCSVLFNLIQLINFWFDLILLCGTCDIVTSSSISISIIIIIIISSSSSSSSSSNSISTRHPSSAEIDSVSSWHVRDKFNLLLLLLLLLLELATL
jgi:hypothetical protein